MEQKNFKIALTHFLVIEKQYPRHFETQTNLATCYLKLGQWKHAKSYYLKALDISPNDIQILFNLGVITAQQKQVKEAIAFYLRVLEVNPDFYEAHHNLGIIYLSIKETQTALHHFEKANRLQPNNVAIRHTLNVLQNEKKLVYSPPEYIQSLFDAYADHYDLSMLQSLNYQVPRLFYEAVQFIKVDNKSQWDILDLGCGTGLCGEWVKPWAKSLTGVDLSQAMLEMAQRKKRYDQLIQSDALLFLSNKKTVYDLILAGDILVYIGDLDALFAAIFHALKPNGFFIFNTEISEKESYQMTVSGRFVHYKNYLDQQALRNGLTILKYNTAVLRTQDQSEVQGHIYLLKKEFL